MRDNKDILIYGYITQVILSNHKFKNNIDIKTFLENKTSLFLNDDEKFKDYVYKTRTLILARTIRITEKREDKSQLYNEFKKAIYNEEENVTNNKTSNKKQNNTKKKKKKNKFDDLLEQFER